MIKFKKRIPNSLPTSPTGRQAGQAGKSQTSISGINIVGRSRLWYAISLVILVTSTMALIAFGLKLGIDFTGGSILEVAGDSDATELQQIAEQSQVDEPGINSAGTERWLIKYRLQEGAEQIQTQFESNLKTAGLSITRFDQVGPSISRDLAKNALSAIGFMSLAVIFYIAWAFRRVGKSVSGFKFGMVTLFTAFLHDALFIVGVFAVLGKVLGVEVDSYIVTAVLTVIGFSIHDTIVVFDRVREKLSQSQPKEQLASLVNQSVNETVVRSLNTSLVIILVLLALFLFGGESTRYFILALLVGMVVGTYSSIFIASPLLVSWYNFGQRR